MAVQTANETAAQAVSERTEGATLEELAGQFRRDGFCVARQLFTAAEIDEIRETFMTQAKDGPVEGLSDGHYKGLASTDPLSFYPRMMHPHRHPDKVVGPVAMHYMLDRRIYAILKGTMGGEPVATQSMFYFKPAGARGQDLHQDNFYLRVKPDTCYAAWIAVDDSDSENGGMMVVPGSQDADVVCPSQSDPAISFTGARVPVPEGLKAEIVPLKAGDVLFFNGSLIHGSFPNTSKDRFRRSLIFHYAPQSSDELSRSYSSITFDGGEIDIPAATGGGPCGDSLPAGPH